MAASTTPTSTIGTFLMHGGSKLLDVKSVPALGGSPELIEVTTLSDTFQKQVPGVQALDSLEFTANYTLEKYDELKALENKDEEYQVWMGYEVGTDGELTPTGDDGKFKFTARLSVYINEQSVNAAREMTITLVPLSAIAKVTA